MVKVAQHPSGHDDDRLEALSAITDVALNQLSVDELMEEVLQRIRHILDVDTVTMLRLLPSGDHLVADAAVGIEEEVRQGVVIPVGQGFAGVIAETRRPAVLEQVNPDTVANPILWERGLQTMLGVPLLRDEHTIGVLHVGRIAARPFTEVDLEMLSVAAERVAGAITASQFATEAAAARLLERSLLPGHFPVVSGAEFAGRYSPAYRRIGGDWYDAFVLPNEELWLIVGDVAGHGLRSAVTMGRVRSTLRAYAMLGGGPAHVLELADRKVHHFEMSAMATVLCAVGRPPYARFEISAAGHPPPVVATPGQHSATVSIPHDLPLGSFPGTPRSSTTVDLSLGSALVLYTDGLVERIGESIDEGIGRLCAVTEAAHPEIICRTIMRKMISDTSPDDDIALLVMRHTATK